jgi:hypothetical protein
MEKDTLILAATIRASIHTAATEATQRTHPFKEVFQEAYRDIQQAMEIIELQDKQRQSGKSY